MPWLDEKLCAGCNICVRVCPVPGAISVQPGKLPVIDNEICTRCGKCMQVCPRNAIRPNSENSFLRGDQQVQGHAGGGIEADRGTGGLAAPGQGHRRNAGIGRSGTKHGPGRSTGRGRGR